MQSTLASAAPARVPAPLARRDAGRAGRDCGAFDLLLATSLHRAFDAVSNEPVPDELLKLLAEPPV